MSVRLMVTDEHRIMLNDCVKRKARLTDWEIEFIDNLVALTAPGYGLSLAQLERLDLIWEKATAKG